MRQKILKFALIFQGLYWGFAGLWAVISVDHFSLVTGLHAEPLDVTGRFEMISIAMLSIVLSLFFLWGAFNKKLLKPAALLAVGTAIAVIIPEAIYLPQMQGVTLFWLDFAEEIVIAVVILVALFFKSVKKGADLL